MQQSPEPEQRPPLHVMNAGCEVAGYFDQGKWVSVTFGNYIDLLSASGGNTDSLKYLQKVQGFAGAIIMQPMMEGLPAIAFPWFTPAIPTHPELSSQLPGRS